MKMNSKSKTFCILPWMHLATNSSGNYRVCCNSTPGKNFILDKDGAPYKIYKADVKEMWNSDTYRKLRLQLLKEEYPSMCQRCWREEASNIKSARQSFNEAYEHFIEGALSNTDKEGKAPLKVGYVDLRLGNLCNLKCRMCNPWASNQWTKEWNTTTSYDGKDIPDEERTRLEHMDWPTNEKTWENLMPIINSVEEIYLTGGEPTLALEQYKLFDHCIKLNKAKDIVLKYNTNLTNIPPKMIEYWKHFKKIKINASIDGFDELNRYIRYPTNWKSVDKNLKIFHEMEKEGKMRVQVHTTVQLYNILDLTDLFEYVDQFGYFPYLNILDHPDYLNVRVLPLHLKECVAEELQTYIDKPKIKGLIKYMMDEDWSQHTERFIEYTNWLDKSRKQNILDIVPGLEDVINSKRPNKFKKLLDNI
tara:strand:- start:586 stop:1842 length:1257 start_codon:yes stop_codon:yes gene_type:complete